MTDHSSHRIIFLLTVVEFRGRNLNSGYGKLEAFLSGPG